MKSICILCAIGLAFSTTAAFARGGGMGGMSMGASHMSVTGGAFGTSAASPGTNSLGTALSSTGAGRPMKGPLLGTLQSDLRQHRWDRTPTGWSQ